jgi:hypothetical protein
MFFCVSVVLMEINKKFRPDTNPKLMDQTKIHHLILVNLDIVELSQLSEFFCNFCSFIIYSHRKTQNNRINTAKTTASSTPKIRTGDFDILTIYRLLCDRYYILIFSYDFAVEWHMKIADARCKLKSVYPKIKF